MPERKLEDVGETVAKQLWINCRNHLAETP